MVRVCFNSNRIRIYTPYPAWLPTKFLRPMAQEMEGRETIEIHTQEAKTTAGEVKVVIDEEVAAAHPLTTPINC
jgi:hypothetical protein